ncbi:hypothetical protein D1818_20365 [Aquimarina sp. BL5]|uniref:hypothetical protein n=1 Tax=Aquimarina sp. BL5 TaxID=1714860 RepID=UPI000E529BA1|nr:hypothetical protein [Aquimarina sp. BL5]AXT53064.1 hypothetical protein D1818_20365 [Aquimarina sp. BL5]RKM95060.1 hypothetical protein D7036_21575 [Aquimarina sp. BL5]
MKKITGIFMIILLVTSCDVQQKKEAKLPEVDVDIDTEAGQLPTFDVDWADVNVGTKTKMVKIPKVVVVMEEVEVEVPYVDVDMPNSGEKEELTLTVEAEVTDKEHSIDIKEIIASNDKLYVISKLKELDQDLGDKKLRVSDRVILNAPDLNVKHIIMGEKPDRVFNDQYKYVKDISAFKADLKESKVIFTK